MTVSERPLPTHWLAPPKYMKAEIDYRPRRQDFTGANLFAFDAGYEIALAAHQGRPPRSEGRVEYPNAGMAEFEELQDVLHAFEAGWREGDRVGGRLT